MNWICREFSFGSPEYRASLILREEVLRKPLGLPLRPEDTEGEDYSFHLGCFLEQRLVGSLILKPIEEATVRLRQFAVAPDTQGQGAGSDLLQFAENFARERGCQTIVAHVRDQYFQFYIKRGYRLRGSAFIEVTLRHLAVFKELRTDPRPRDA